MMSIPIKQGGDSNPIITMKQAHPRASPHCRSKCCVFPAIWRGFPSAPCTTPPNGFKGPHWARYRHHTENPMQVTEAPVSTRQRTGMPSRLSWPVMGWSTAHPTGVTLASGDPPNGLNAHEGSLVAIFCGRPFQDLSSGSTASVIACLLAQQALEDWASWAVWHKVSLFSTQKAARRSPIRLPARRPKIWAFFWVVLVEVASGWGGRRLSGSQRRGLSERRQVSGSHSDGGCGC